MKLEVLADAERLADFAARRIASILRATDGEAAVALAGGSTPRKTYERLATMDIPWQRIALFLGDERFVPLTDPASNFRMVVESLGAGDRDRIQLHAVQTDLTPEAAAAGYEAMLADFAGRSKLFDLVILGLGADGHTASLFPGSAVLDETARLVRPTENGRITLTYAALNSSRHTIFLVSGTEKRAALRRLLTQDTSIPAGRIQGDITIFADAAAA
ncbi:MAG: 6-phosphogluconolactonase [Alphaproteobacteria bacterium]|nr:6-phosphogluconolactonase [Alphaproteobacteria bacterium]